MDTTKVFDTLDRKIERLLLRLKSLEGENEKLKATWPPRARPRRMPATLAAPSKSSKRSRIRCASASRSSSTPSKPPRKPASRNAGGRSGHAARLWAALLSVRQPGAPAPLRGNRADLARVPALRARAAGEPAASEVTQRQYGFAPLHDDRRPAAWEQRPPEPHHLFKFWIVGEALAAHGLNGRLVDVGCGSGLLQEYLKTLGWKDPVGIEPSGNPRRTGAFRPHDLQRSRGRRSAPARCRRRLRRGGGASRHRALLRPSRVSGAAPGFTEARWNRPHRHAEPSRALHALEDPGQPARLEEAPVSTSGLPQTCRSLRQEQPAAARPERRIRDPGRPDLYPGLGRSCPESAAIRPLGSPGPGRQHVRRCAPATSVTR